MLSHTTNRHRRRGLRRSLATSLGTNVSAASIYQRRGDYVMDANDIRVFGEMARRDPSVNINDQVWLRKERRCGSLSGISIADAVDLVVSVGSAQLRSCDPTTATTPMGWRLWCNTRRTAIRRTVRIRHDNVATIPLRRRHDAGVQDHYPTLDLETALPTRQLQDQLRKRALSTGLVNDTVASQIAADIHHHLSTDDGRVLNPEMARTDDLAHRITATIDGHLARHLRRRIESTGLVEEAMIDLIVDTRVLGRRLCDRAADHNVAVPTLRKRRQRAERRLRQALAA